MNDSIKINAQLWLKIKSVLQDIHLKKTSA